MEIIDIIFYLDGQSLQEIIRSIVISLGWNYIALWSLDQQALDLACKDGWFNPEMETGSSTAQSLGQTLFILYKLCRFALDAGVQGLALNRSTCVWLTSNELLHFSSDESQKEFYRVAGVQTAVFIPCGNGLVELGTTNFVQPDEQIKLRISSLLASVIVSPNISVPVPIPGTTSISSSSCSPLLSCSIDSAESSSMVSYLQYPNMTTGDQINIPPYTHQYSISDSELASGFYPFPQTLQLPSSCGLLIGDRDHETALVYPGFSQQMSVPVAPSARNIMLSAFGMWRPLNKAPNPPVVEGQYKLKRCLGILRNIHAEKLGKISMSGSLRPPAGTVSSSQVHHMISERKRREKMKENFQALRSLLPGCSRKDKASILAYTREYLISLKSRAEEVEERNKQLESELKKLPRARSQSPPTTTTNSEGGDSVVTVEVSKMGGSSGTDEMGIVVVVERPSNTIDLMITVLKSLREMRIPLISMATSTVEHQQDPSRLQFRMTATIKLQDHDLERLKEGLASAVRKDVLALIISTTTSICINGFWMFPDQALNSQAVWPCAPAVNHNGILTILPYR